jgi:hypothetical protein
MTGTDTSRLGLYKPDPDDDINVTTDVNNNYDKLDSFVGTTVCTSGTRPNAPYEGQGIYETDTGKLLVSNGTSPASGSWQDPVTNILTATNVTIGGSGTTVTMPGRVLSERSTSTSTALDVQVADDTTARFSLDQSGAMEWGSGAATRDVNLYRAAVGTLATDDSLQVGGDLDVSGIGQVQFVYKAADETVTSSTTLQNDNDLTLPVVANGIYLVDLNLVALDAGNFTGDLKTCLAYPTGSTVHVMGVGPHDTGLSSGTNSTAEWVARTDQSGTSSTSTSYGAGTTAVTVMIRALVIVGSTAGSVTLQWAQNTSDASGVTLKTGSWMRMERVG